MRNFSFTQAALVAAAALSAVPADAWGQMSPFEHECRERSIAIDVESFKWQGTPDEINRRIAQERKALFEGPCAASRWAPGQIEESNKILGLSKPAAAPAVSRPVSASAAAPAAGRPAPAAVAGATTRQFERACQHHFDQAVQAWSEVLRVSGGRNVTPLSSVRTAHETTRGAMFQQARACSPAWIAHTRMATTSPQDPFVANQRISLQMIESARQRGDGVRLYNELSQLEGVRFFRCLQHAAIAFCEKKDLPLALPGTASLPLARTDNSRPGAHGASCAGATGPSWIACERAACNRVNGTFSIGSTGCAGCTWDGGSATSCPKGSGGVSSQQ